jgi:hypothetical protein
MLHRLLLPVGRRVSDAGRALVALSLSGAIGLSLPACDDEVGTKGGTDGAASCTTNLDCDLPLSCIEGRCQVECRGDRDCGNGATCFEGACFSYPPTCRLDNECAPFGEVCDRVRNRCVPPGSARCDDDLAPCPGGQVCNAEGRCQLPGADVGPRPDQGPDPDQGPRPDRGPDPDQGPRADRGPDPDQGPRADRGPDPDQGPRVDQGPDCPPQGNGRYGDPCLGGNDCATGFCVENKLRGQRVCTDLCNLDAANPAATCPGIDACVAAEVQPAANPDCPGPIGVPPAGSIVGVCFTNETGLPCDFDRPRPGECIGGACIQPINPAAAPYPWMGASPVCGTSCVDDRRCPTGTTCREVGNAGRVCAPLLEWLVRCDGEINNCGGACPSLTPQQEVDNALCLTVNGQVGGYCSCQCQSNRDCHTGYACGPIGGGVKACIPFAGLRCPAEGANPGACVRNNQCAAEEICLNGFCQQLQCPSLTCLIDDVDPRLNRCTAQCVNANDCPGGYDCQQFEGFGGFCVSGD